MDLFSTKLDYVKVNENILKIETPIGTIFFGLKFANNSIEQYLPHSTKKISEETFISQWIFNDEQIEFLRTNIQPIIPEGMNIDKCIGGFWRIKSISESLRLKFSCELIKNSDEIIDLDSENGEGVIAQSWQSNHTKLSIGTEDEDYLARRSNNEKFFPKRLYESIVPELIQTDETGIKIELPNLLMNEVVQIQFIIAWSSKEKKEISTWLSVDESPFKILSQLNIN